MDQPQYGYMRPDPKPFGPDKRPQKTNGKSIAALVLGILALIVPYLGFVIGIVAIVIASIALKEIRLYDELGKGLAIAGLVCGIVGTALYAFFVLMTLFAVITFSAF